MNYTLFTGIYPLTKYTNIHGNILCKLYIDGNIQFCYNDSGGKGGVFVATTKAQQRAVHKYVKANYDRVELTVPKGWKQEIKVFAESKGFSVNSYINSLICKDMGISADEWESKAEENQESAEE